MKIDFADFIDEQSDIPVAVQWWMYHTAKRWIQSEGMSPDLYYKRAALLYHKMQQQRQYLPLMTERDLTALDLIAEEIEISLHV